MTWRAAECPIRGPAKVKGPLASLTVAHPGSGAALIRAAVLAAGSAVQGLSVLYAIRLRVQQDGDDDIPTLRALVDYLKKEESKKRRDYKLEPNTPQYIVVLIEALDHALDMIGRTGKEVLYAMLEERYELRPTDIALRPGEFMSALRHLLGHPALVIESEMLAWIKETTEVKGWSLEDAVDKLKAAYPDPGSRHDP